MSAYVLSKPAYVYNLKGQEYLGFLMGNEYDKTQARFEIMSMLDNLPDLAKGTALEQDIKQFEKWQADPGLPKPKRKKRK